MDIKNVDLKQQQIKRDRALNYWQNNVIMNHLPSVDRRKQKELQRRKNSMSPALNSGPHYF